jgi:hypothetical protein
MEEQGNTGTSQGNSHADQSLTEILSRIEKTKDELRRLEEAAKEQREKMASQRKIRS